MTAGPVLAPAPTTEPKHARTSTPMRWLPFAAAFVLVRFLPPWFVVAMMLAGAAALAFRVVRRRQTMPLAAGLAVLDAVLALAVLRSQAAPFAGVWLLTMALPLPDRIGTRRIGHLIEDHIAASLAIAVGVVLLLAFPIIPGAIFLGPRYAGAGWLFVVYAGVAFLRPVAASTLHRLDEAVHPRSIAIGMALTQVGFVVGLTPSASTLVVTALLSVLVIVSALSVKEWTPTIAAVPSDQTRNLFGLPPANVVVGLMAIGLAVRLLVERGLWLDEAIGISQARLPFGQMLTELRYGDIHPPLYEAILWVTIRLFSAGEMIVRAPSIVAGTLLIPLLYVAGRDIYDKRAGVMAATLGTIAPLLVWYSQEARMYAVLLVFSVSALWFQVRAVRKGGYANWIAFGGCLALMLWTHYFAVLQVVVQIGALAANVIRKGRMREDLRNAGIAILTFVVLVAPLIPFVRAQMASSGQLVGLGLPSRNPGLDELSIYAVFANGVWALWGYHSATMMRQIVALWPLGMLFVLFLLGRGRARATWLLAGVIILPTVALFLAGLRLRDLFEVRYFIFAVPALLLVIAHLVTRASSRRFPTYAVAALLIVTFAIALADQQISNSNPRRFDFSGALSYVRANAKPDDVVLYTPRYLESVVDYYAPDAKQRALERGPYSEQTGRTFVVASWNLSDRLEPKWEMEQYIARSTNGEAPVAELRRKNIEVRVYR